VGLDCLVVAAAYCCDFLAGSPENEGVDASDAPSTEDADLVYRSPGNKYLVIEIVIDARS
jgi:hypothetical protein